MGRLPQIDDSRVYGKRRAFHTRATANCYLPPNHATYSDISPEEIEARYQRRLAELRYERLQKTSDNNGVSEG